MTTATDEHARIGMNSNTSLHYSARRLGICVGLKLLTVTNAALYFVAALLRPRWHGPFMRVANGD